MDRSVLISQYPVTADYLSRFRAHSGEDAENIVVSNITASGYRELFAYLRNIKTGVVYIALVEATALPVIPPLVMLSHLIPAEKRILVMPGFSFRVVHGRDLVRYSGQFLLAFASGMSAMVRSGWQAFQLKSKSRIKVGQTGYDNALYLKSSLWLGVQAGGAMTHTLGVIRGLLSKGVDVCYVASDVLEGMGDERHLDSKRIPLFKSYCVPRELNYYRLNVRIGNEKWAETRADTDFVYQRLSPGNIAGVLRSRRRKVPLVVEYNGSEIWLSRNWGTSFVFEKVARLLENVTLKHAHLIVVVSEALKRELILRGIRTERILFQPNGVDIERFDPALFTDRDMGLQRQRLNISKDAFVVTFVGTFGLWHGVDVLARALREFYDTDPEWMEKHRLHILFVGDGVQRTKVEKILDQPGLERFYTLGHLISPDKIPGVLAASNAFITPTIGNADGTEFFGSPTKLFEYLAMARPVIASDLGQLRDILHASPMVTDLAGDEQLLSEHATGLRVRPGNPADTVTAIRFLAEHPGWCDRAASNARALVKNKYTWNHHVGNMLERLKTVHALEEKPRPIRILINGLHSKSGGGVTYLANMLGLLAADKDVEIHLCIHESQRDLIDHDSGVYVHQLRFKEGFWRLLLREQIVVPKLARRISVDVTFSPANYGPVFAGNSVILLRNALSVAFVERRFGKWLYWVLLSLATVISMAFAKKIITVSEYAKRSAGGGLLNIFKHRFSIIPHGISNRFHATDEKRENFLLAVSDLYVQKNLKNLILAIARLKKKNPAILLKIAGRAIDGDYAAELVHLVKIHDLESNVEFMGHVPPENLVRLYQKCCLFVFPSSIETFGNPLVEAMASGAAVVCSNVAAMPEVVGDAARFFNPQSVEDMTRAISEVVDNDDLRRQMSARSIRQSKRYSWEKTAQETLKVLKSAGGR